MNVKLADNGQNDKKVTLHFYIYSIVHLVILSPQMTFLKLLQHTCSKGTKQQQTPEKTV